MKFLSRTGAITYKELVELSRDRTTFGMVIAIPLIQLVLFGYAINTDVRHIPVALVDQSNSAVGFKVTQSIAATQVADFKVRFASVEEAQAAITSGKVRAALILPPDLTNRYTHKLAAQTVTGEESQYSYEINRPLGQWIVDGSDTMIASAIMSLRNMPLTSLSHYPVNRTAATFEVVLFYNPAQISAINIVPGIVGVILTMTMIMFTSVSIVREQEQGNLELLITTPVRSIELMMGKIIPYIFVGLFQMAIIIGLGHLVFDVPVNGSILQLILVTLLFIAASLILGLILSTIAKTQLQATQMTIFVMLPSILLSGFMFPYEGMPEPAQWIAEILPATHFMRMIRGVVLREANIFDLANDAIWFFGFIVLGLAIASLRFKKRLD